MAEHSSFPFGQTVVWQPDPSQTEHSNLNRFMQKHGISNYDSLFAKSVHDIAWFWNAVLEDLNIEFYRKYDRVVDLSAGIQFPRWCVNGEMNIVHNCLDKWLNKQPDQIALRYESEAGDIETYTYRQLNDEVCRCANALREAGLGKGDAIGLYMPMIPELVIAFLAVIKTGGLILPLFSGYGPSAIISRLSDGGAKAVFCADGVLRRGKPVAMKPNLDEALRQVPSVKKVIVSNRNRGAIELPMDGDRDTLWPEFLQGKSTVAETEHTAAEEVLMLIYTSGTTGKPKGAVHTHCGFPVKSAQDMYQPMDLRRNDVMYWMTDMGWMMGPWEVFGTLLIGATMVFYDGAPDYPAVDRTWQLVENHGITHLGVSPTLIRALKPHGTAPVRKHDVSSLRMAGSTGSPWDPESWMWLFEKVLESRKPIINYSGGTEISGGIVCGNFFKPLKPCAFSGPVVGMDADVVDENGRPLRGAVGELVIRKPWIGMTRGFWKDRQRYLETYWSRWDDVWLHGDFAAIDEDGLWYILGRSDDTIKVAGKRLGPAEVESILNAHPAVAESAAIGVPHEVKGQVVVAFCVLKAGKSESEELRKELSQLLIDGLGKALQPKEIRFTSALPKTRNAKVMHRVIRAAYLGQEMGDLSSIENPATVEAVKKAR